MKPAVKKGDILELTIDDLAFGARGVARMDGFVWFIRGAIPGQTVQAKVRRVRKDYGEATVHEIVEPSPNQVEPPCPYFGTCGGCQLQHLEYELQVEYKTRQIRELLSRVGGFENPPVHPTLPADPVYAYRNKMEFTFSDRRWIVEGENDDLPEDFALGLHVPGRFDKVLHLESCLLQSEACSRILRTLGQLTRDTGLPAYNIRNHTGFWRFLVLREGKETGDLLLNLITSSQAPDRGKETLDWIVHKLFWRHPEISTVIHTISDSRAQVALGEPERLLLGLGQITEKIGEKEFTISPDAFFQTNTSQTLNLFETIGRLAQLKGTETLYDLYCGTGAIGIYLSDRVSRIIGIEAIVSAVQDGKENIARNHVKNMDIIQGDMRDILRKSHSLLKKHPPDLVILDPPRGGPHPHTIRDLAVMAPPRLIYVSCNPGILARDLKRLCEEGFQLEEVQPVDMFPHTGHIETVALLTKK
jgi:23S rRNA (uracil1939-C5)-methyltransferase